MKKFLKQLWQASAYWANPVFYSWRERYQKDMLEISHMCSNYGMDGMSATGLEKIRARIREHLDELGLNKVMVPRK